MKEFIDTDQKKLKSLLSDDHEFFIPKYQREYSWEDEHIDDFWNDLYNHFMSGEKIEYYFGTIILVNKNDSGEQFSVVDGQQRLTTTITFLSVIRDLFLDLSQDTHAKTVNDFIFLEEGSQILHLSKNNSEFFNTVILPMKKYSEKKDDLNKNVNIRNKTLAQCYERLRSKLKSIIDSKIDDNEKVVLLTKIYQHFLKYFVIVRTVIDSPGRAYKIFESINNRGAGLAESDLVKNYLLELVDHDKLDVDLAHDNWISLLSILGLTKVKEDDFLWNYLLAFVGPTVPGEVFSTIQKTVKSGTEAIDFIQKLIDAANLYNELKKPDLKYWEYQKVVDSLISFSDLSAKAVYPALLVGHEVFGNKKKEFLEFMEILQIYYFRTRTICKTGAPEIRKVIDHICAMLRDKSKPPSISKIKQFLYTHKTYPKDPQFEFNFGIFHASQKNALYILIHLNQEMTKIKHMTLTAQKENIQIEHIMPKTIKNSSWDSYFEEELGLKNSTARNDYHKNNLWRLGNLTLLNPISNPIVSNDPFSVKKESYKNDNANITSSLENYSEWNEKSINLRQENLAQFAKKIWNLDG